MVEVPQIIFGSLWPSWPGSSTITRITSEVVQNAVPPSQCGKYQLFWQFHGAQAPGNHLGWAPSQNKKIDYPRHFSSEPHFALGVL